MKKGDRVEINIPETPKHGKSQFHKRNGTLAYRSDIGGRWFVQLDGDKEGDCVEFLPSEMTAISPSSPH
jgi:hypothetical protein